jgi:hypothetical protein
MTVIEKNQGPKVAYEVTGNKITFGDDEITLNLQRYERDDEVQIDICRDDEHILIAGPSKYFVANIIIPARQYDGETPVPFSMDNVTLVLWALIDNEEV